MEQEKEKAPIQPKKNKPSHDRGYCAKHGLLLLRFQRCKLITRFLLYPDRARLKILPFYNKKTSLKLILDG